MTWHSSPSTLFKLTHHSCERSIEDYHRRPLVPFRPVVLLTFWQRDSVSPKSVHGIVLHLFSSTIRIVWRAKNGAQKTIQSQKRRQTENRNPHLPAEQTAPFPRRSSRPQKRRDPRQSRRRRPRSQPQ